jgi:hypothetical protein
MVRSKKTLAEAIAAHPYPNPLPKVVKSKANLLTDVAETLEDAQITAKRNIARVVDLKLKTLTEASAALDTPTDGKAIYELKNFHSGVGSMYEELGKLEVYIIMSDRLGQERAEGTPDEILARLRAYLVHLSFDDHSIANLSSSDQYSNVINANMGEGRMRARRDLNSYLQRVATDMSQSPA